MVSASPRARPGAGIPPGVLSFCFCCCPGGRPPSDAVFRSCLPFSPVSAFARICAAFVYLPDLVTCPVLTPGVPFWRPHFSPDARLAHVTASGEVAVTVQDRGGPSRRGGGAGVCPRAGSCSGLVFLGSGGEAAGQEAPRGRAGESAVGRPPGAAGVLPRRGASASDVRPGVAAPVMTGGPPGGCWACFAESRRLHEGLWPPSQVGPSDAGYDFGPSNFWRLPQIAW